MTRLDSEIRMRAEMTCEWWRVKVQKLASLGIHAAKEKERKGEREGETGREIEMRTRGSKYLSLLAARCKRQFTTATHCYTRIAKKQLAFTFICRCCQTDLFESRARECKERVWFGCKQRLELDGMATPDKA